MLMVRLRPPRSEAIDRSSTVARATRCKSSKIRIEIAIGEKQRQRHNSPYKHFQQTACGRYVELVVGDRFTIVVRLLQLLQFRFHHVHFVNLLTLQAVLLQVVNAVAHHQRQIDVVVTVAPHHSQTQWHAKDGLRIAQLDDLIAETWLFRFLVFLFLLRLLFTFVFVARFFAFVFVAWFLAFLFALRWEFERFRFLGQFRWAPVT